MLLSGTSEADTGTLTPAPTCKSTAEKTDDKERKQ